MMKKFITLFTVMTLLLSLCACTVAQPEAPSTEESQAPIWQEQYDLGVRYLSESNYQEAIIAFTAAIEIDPKQAPAYVGRGDAYVLSGETEANLAVAKTDYEKAIELDETIVEAYLGLADVYVRQGDYEKAMEILQQGLEKTGQNQTITDKIAEMESAQGSEVIDDNPPLFVTLLREGDSGNLLRADEVTFLGFSLENLSINDAGQILSANGYYCKKFDDRVRLDGYFNSDGQKDEHGRIITNDGRLGGDYGTVHARVGPASSDSTASYDSLICDFDFQVNTIGHGPINIDHGPISIGIRDICLMDSIEAVFSKLGFSNAAGLADYINSLSYEEEEQLREGFHYFNEAIGESGRLVNKNFLMYYSYWCHNEYQDYWDFTIFLLNVPNARNHVVQFIFDNISDTGTYLLSSATIISGYGY